MLDIDIFLFSLIKSRINISINVVNALKRLGIVNLRDLLFYRPSSYQVKLVSPILSLVQEGQLIQAEIVIQEIIASSGGRQPLRIVASNETGVILLVFFTPPPPFILSMLNIGSKHLISGKVQIFSNVAQIIHPELILDKRLAGSIEPIYPLTYGIVNKQLYGYILKSLDFFEQEYNKLPIISSEAKSYIGSLLDDLKILHLYQIDEEKLEEMYSNCLRRLAERELLSNQLSLQYIRRKAQIKQGHSFSKSSKLQKSILQLLGFKLTTEQKKVIEEIEQDQLAPSEMLRLLQGDVGSGKTIVALLTMINVVQHHHQTVLMAPTDLLANQHYQFFVKALEGTKIRIAMLTGKISLKEKNKVLASLEAGDIDILIGTHALFQEKVNFKNLGYIVIDEQHKFGVQQRLELINKASSPDVLVMTATPIPRSLTLTMFGDMLVSKLASKPKNRLPIITSLTPNTKLASVINVLGKKIQNGEKIYWICPFIDANEEKLIEQGTVTRAIDVNTRLKTISDLYPNIVATIHGKMKNEQKDSIMQRFKEGELQILVATTVIEVGIDVPLATLIVIENAEQFGLAQLHQIRGRVGRGSIQSHCILLYDPKRMSISAKSRFEVMRSSNDGFFIAEQDLLLRGSGEILGTKQSGEIRFFFADLARDTNILITANKLAEESIKEDSEFASFQIKLFALTANNDHQN